MAIKRKFSIAIFGRQPRLFAAAVAAGISLGNAQTVNPDPQNGATVTLDRVVAVVNHQAILASDIVDEIQLSVLDPSRVGLGELTAGRALQQLISRTLIEQQLRQDDIQAAEPTAEEVAARLQQIRTQLPTCVRNNCASDAGWNAFLASHDLTPDRVKTY